MRYCNKIKSHVNFYKNQIKSLNKTIHHILKDIDLILPQFLINRKEKRSVFASIITGFIGLAYEGIPSILHNRRHKALHKAVNVMEMKTNIQCNKRTHIEDTMVLYDSSSSSSSSVESALEPPAEAFLFLCTSVVTTPTDGKQKYGGWTYGDYNAETLENS